MNKYIKDNIAYYDITSEMQNKIAQLEHALIETKTPELIIPNNPVDAHRFFCDLLGLGYHASKAEILQRISITIK